MVGYLKNFLSNEDPDLRAKACSAIGNMCRHSSYFYSSLVRKYFIHIWTIVEIFNLVFREQATNKVIELVVDRCSDPDKRTRKFACFAVSF